jgi:hypothetical protein
VIADRRRLPREVSCGFCGKMIPMKYDLPAIAISH